MTNRDCRKTRRELDELALGYRPGLDASAHLAVCSACREFQTERNSLRELVGSLEPVIAPPDFDMRLRARIASEKYEERRQPFFARLVSTPALAAAALFVIVAGSVVWISRRPATPVTVATRPAIAETKHPVTVPAPVDQPKGTVAPASNEGGDVATANPIRTVHRGRGSKGATTEDLLSRGVDDPIRQTDSDQAYVPNRPVEFALQDERGKTRKISLPAVSFGAQNLVGSNRPTDVKYTETSRVW